MSDKVLAFDIGLRKETKSKFTGPDYSVDSRPVSIDGNNLCGGTPNSTKAGGKGESLGMNTQKPIEGRLVTGEMGTVSMEIEKTDDEKSKRFGELKQEREKEKFSKQVEEKDKEREKWKRFGELKQEYGN